MLLLSACATHLTVPTDALLDQREQRLLAIQDWQFTGKLGIRSETGSGSLYLNWVQHPAGFSLDLHGPLGQGGGRLVDDGYQSTLAQDDQVYRSLSAQALVKDRFGWDIPIDDLKYWVRALPSLDIGGARELTRDEQGLLIRQTQNDWSLEYSDYQWVDEQALPGKIKAQSDTLGIRLTLIVSQWHLGAIQ